MSLLDSSFLLATRLINHPLLPLTLNGTKPETDSGTQLSDCTETYPFSLYRVGNSPGFAHPPRSLAETRPAPALLAPPTEHR